MIGDRIKTNAYTAAQFRTATSMANRSLGWHTRSEFRPPVLNGLQRSVNRKAWVSTIAASNVAAPRVAARHLNVDPGALEGPRRAVGLDQTRIRGLLGVG